MDLTQVYNLGIIVDTAGTRLETKLSEINYITQFFLNVNFIKNIKPTYVEINFATDTDAQINSKLTSDTVNIWITAVENSKVLRLWQSFFKYKPVNDTDLVFYPDNLNKLLISVCDDLFELIDYKNILHISDFSYALIRQFEKIIWNRISVFQGQNYTTVYILHNSQNQYLADALNILFQNDDVQQEKTYITVNTSNFAEYSIILTKIQADVQSGVLTYDNTLFIYLQDTYEVYFQIFSLVENPVELGDPEIARNYRHYLWYQSYINMNYIDCFALMNKYLVPKFIPFGSSQEVFSEFFRTKLRAFVTAQSLTKFQNERLNYLNYVYYVRSPIDSEFLRTNRITIYTVLLEKAITTAKEILYRDLYSLDQFYEGSIYSDGRMLGPINLFLTGYIEEDSYFSQIVFITYPLGNLYYITITGLTKNKTIGLKEANLVAGLSASGKIPGGRLPF